MFAFLVSHCNLGKNPKHPIATSPLNGGGGGGGGGGCLLFVLLLIKNSADCTLMLCLPRITKCSGRSSCNKESTTDGPCGCVFEIVGAHNVALRVERLCLASSECHYFTISF